MASQTPGACFKTMTKAVSVLASLMVCGSFLSRQQGDLRFLVRPAGMSDCFSGACCMGNFDPVSPSSQEQLRPLLRQTGVQSEYIEGTTIYVLSTTSWSRQGAQKRLRDVFHQVKHQSSLDLRYIDESATSAPRWQLFAALGGLILLACFVAGRN
jgi:hypothetical protein